MVDNDMRDRQYTHEDVLEIARLAVSLGRDFEEIARYGTPSTRMNDTLARMKQYERIFDTIIAELNNEVRLPYDYFLRYNFIERLRKGARWSDILSESSPSQELPKRTAKNTAYVDR